MFKIGAKVRISQDIDNYEEFKDEVLVIIEAYNNTEEHPGYDDSMKGMALYDLELIDGSEFPYSLYEYELERA